MNESVAVLPVNCPISGDWVAVNTPAERVPSHGTHFFGQTYAYDFARVSESGQSFSRHPLWQQFLLRVPAHAFFAWDQPVFAAFPGVVVAAQNDWPDRLHVNSLWEVLRAHLLQRRPKENDLRPLLGNYVLVQGDVGVGLYAHLRRDSIEVRKGDEISLGQRVGAVGNSGNSTMPHLHFQVTDTADLQVAKGLLCGFRGASHAATDMNPDSPLVPSLMKTFYATVPKIDA